MRRNACRLGIGGVAAFMVLSVLAAPGQASGPAGPLAGGHWVVETPRVMAQALPLSQPPPPNTGCPRGTSNGGAYSCLEVVKDGSGHGVWIRYGRSGSSGFGFLHFYKDHNLDLGPVEATIGNSAYGIGQSNGRFLYGEYYVAPNHQIDQYVEIHEDRSEAGNHDGRELGVVTAYCQGPGHSYEARCPDWVNTTL